MSRWTPVSLVGCGAVGPFGVGIAAFDAWWKQGCPATAGSITSLSEAWLPFEQACEVPEWRGRHHLPDRKAIKLMTRRVQLGVAAALEAWGEPTGGEGPPPERRAMYTGCGVPADEDWTFREPIEEAIVEGRFDMRRFAQEGQELLNPLWLVKSLTNNILAFTAKTLDLQGANNNFEAGAAGGLVAVAEAARAISEGRADVALAGAADSLVTVEFLLNLARHPDPPRDPALLTGEAAAFVRLEPSRPDHLSILGCGSAFAPWSADRDPLCSPAAPEGIESALSQARERAWSEAAPFVEQSTPTLRLLGPRVAPESSSLIDSLDLSDSLGDSGAAGGALLLAAAWTLHRSGEVHGPLEISAVSAGGEAACIVVGSHL